MEDSIQDNKFVELQYKVIDEKTGTTLVNIEYPVSYVHGANDILSPEICRVLEGKVAGDTIEVPIDGNELYGPRDESLVFTDRLENVPEEYRELGATILMENDKGNTKEFIVTRIDDDTLTVDGNNPLSGRKLLFILEILSVRDATDEEIEAGGATDAEPDIDELLQ